MVPLIFEKIYLNLKSQLLNLNESLIGFGSGEIIEFIISQTVKEKIDFQAISGSNDTIKHLKELNVTIVNFSEILQIPVYINPIDTYNNFNQIIHNTTGNFTKEKLLAYNSKKFIGIQNHSVPQLDFNKTPVSIEVLPIARSFAAREIVKLHANPVYRKGSVTENGNIILDIYNLNMANPVILESILKNITGVIDCSIFTHKILDLIID